SPEPRLTPRTNFTTEPPKLDEDPMGFLRHTRLADQLRGEPVFEPNGEPAVGEDTNKLYKLRPDFRWLSLVGILGLFIAFGHSILAMSGEETLAQVYREVESPKLLNFKRAALIVFIFSIVMTAGISFMAVILIPDKERMPDYASNLISGLTMNLLGPR